MRSTLRTLLCAAVAVLAVGALAPAATSAGAGSLSGTVLDASGQPFGYAEVLLTSDCGSEFCGAYHPVDETGHYLIGDLAPGTEYCARFFNNADEQTYCFVATDGETLHDVVLAQASAEATVHGTVTDDAGLPVVGAQVWFSGSYDGTTDAEGRYQVSLPPGEHAVEVWLPLDPTPMIGVGTVVVTAGGYETYDIHLPADQPENQAPQGSFTWSRGHGRLVVGGRAADDTAVLKIRVAVLDRNTGKWLRPNGRWGAYAKLPAHAARSKAPSTTWRFSRSLPRGSYGVSLIVIDDQRTRNATPRPWRPVHVTR